MADGVAELNTAYDLQLSFVPVKFTPLLMRDINSLNAMARPVLRLRQPLMRFVRCLKVANVLSIGYEVRSCFQC